MALLALKFTSNTPTFAAGKVFFCPAAKFFVKKLAYVI
jgi:hypothetical protein